LTKNKTKSVICTSSTNELEETSTCYKHKGQCKKFNFCFEFKAILKLIFVLKTLIIRHLLWSWIYCL